jgi:flagellin
MFRINTNMASIIARRHLLVTTRAAARSLERLASGLRINRASDDPASLVASEGMRSQLVGAKQANRNISQAVSLLQTADAGYEQIGNMLLRLKELATQAADGSLNATNRSAIHLEADALLNEINRIAQATTFNGLSLISSAAASQTQGIRFTFYVGDGTNDSVGIANQKAGFNMQGVSVGFVGGAFAFVVGSVDFGPGIYSVAFLTGLDSAANMAVSIDDAVSQLSLMRSRLGAFQGRLERAQQYVQSMIEQTQNAESVIRDTDFAEETAALTRAQILIQAGTMVLQQANLLPQNVLRLLQP